MSYSRLALLLMNLFLACVLTACQSLPSGEAEASRLQAPQTLPTTLAVESLTAEESARLFGDGEAALPQVSLTAPATLAVEIQPLAESAQLTAEQRPEVANQLQDLLDALI